MRAFRSLSAVIAVSAALLAGSASAAPTTGAAGWARPASGAGLVEKVHGWHSHCAWGPGGRYHRHVPGLGNVLCGPPPPVYRAPVPVPACGAWRGECASRWGWGTFEYRRCLRTRGC